MEDKERPSPFEEIAQPWWRRFQIPLHPQKPGNEVRHEIDAVRSNASTWLPVSSPWIRKSLQLHENWQLMKSRISDRYVILLAEWISKFETMGSAGCGLRIA
jgi:hypothetical protein